MWAIDTLFMKLDQCPISEILDKSIGMAQLSDKPDDRDGGDLIYRKLRKPRKASNNSSVKVEPYVAITKKWLFDSAERHFAQPKGPF